MSTYVFARLEQATTFGPVALIERKIPKRAHPRQNVQAWFGENYRTF